MAAGAPISENDEALALAWRTTSLAATLDTNAPAGGACAAVVRAVAQTSSTSTELVELARHKGLKGLHLLVAEHQIAGRGRLGRTWFSAPGASLTFSIALPWANDAPAAASLAVAAAVADALEPPSSSPVDVPLNLLLKWPNDVWVRDASHTGGGRKVAGILLETTAQPDGSRALVVGIGLNLDAPPRTPTDAPYGMAGLRECMPGLNAVDALHAIAPLVVQALTARHAQGDHATVVEAWRASWARRDLLRGQRVVASRGPLPITGTAAGVGAQGELLVRQDDGVVVGVASGEVSVRLVT